MRTFTLLCMIVISLKSFEVSAQYDNATLNGPWFIQLDPTTPYDDNLMYIVFDGSGNILDFSGFCSDAITGTYNVTSSGEITATMSCEGEDYPMLGQLTSTTEGTAEFDQTYELHKVMDPGALATTLSGDLYTEECGAYTVEMTFDNSGILTDAVGLTEPVVGRLYTQGGLFIGHFKSGATDGWNQFSIMGYYADNLLTGIVGLDQSDCGSASVELTAATSGLDLLGNPDVVLYPNPTQNMIYINTASQVFNTIELNIYSAQGVLVKTVFVEQGQEQISVSDLADGVYLVEILSGQIRGVQKVIIQN